ncbi:DUF3579 domain-containing protein [Thiohalophilus sp.]|uniref:DUF3579 domain-containing protein n=1 Tax=Thiohalophilus sp. TaxID=3028392 RepID=UPI002ACE084D|nr:DUF3579 domain-containing protein [Thiohalophilus sp.]MDZ7804634.1 DUF3579 domain-containing protein [Thiohalophilus sp.]
MSDNENDKNGVVVIRGVNQEGSRLRPGDWAERLGANLAHFGRDNRLCYDQAVQPCIIDGEKCLVVARGLADSNPEAYEFLMSFARSNDLKIRLDRRHGERALEPQ